AEDSGGAEGAEDSGGAEGAEDSGGAEGAEDSVGAEGSGSSDFTIADEDAVVGIGKGSVELKNSSQKLLSSCRVSS
ncbi:hypothetical protein EB118_02050, partial [bacterium]|nr:hypothetical protein [bacterium]